MSKVPDAPETSICDPAWLTIAPDASCATMETDPPDRTLPLLKAICRVSLIATPDVSSRLWPPSQTWEFWPAEIAIEPDGAPIAPSTSRTAFWAAISPTRLPSMATVASTRPVAERLIAAPGSPEMVAPAPMLRATRGGSGAKVEGGSYGADGSGAKVEPSDRFTGARTN